MPASATILEGLTTLANEWRAVAFGWHLLFATVALIALSGCRPSTRLVALLLASPVISVGALAWQSGNPFNGTVFAILALALVRMTRHFPSEPIAFASRPLVVTGMVLIGFGWVYPHFLEARPWTSYLYEAPLGLIPCPTLSVVVGGSLILRSFESKAWATTVTSAALLYGMIGVFALGVAIDAVLLAGAIVLSGTAVFRIRRRNAPVHISAASSSMKRWHDREEHLPAAANPPHEEP
jgi:hypothetical protein